MECEWSDSRCLVCASEAPFNKEHVIPKALGGRLWARFLCVSCNSRLGEVEGSWKTDPAVRLAVNNLSAKIPQLVHEIEEGQGYVFDSPLGLQRGRLREGKVRLQSRRLEDESLVVPSETAPKTIETMLRREGKNEAEIAAALVSLDGAKEGQHTQIAKGYAVRTGTASAPRPSLNGSDINPLNVVKIGYEFLAMHVGSGIFHPSLDGVRESLRSGELSLDCCLIEDLHASSYGPFHGLIISQRKPVVVVVRLFGYLVYRVNFPNVWVPAGTPLMAYTIALDSGEEDLSPIDDSVGIKALQMLPSPSGADLPNS